MKQLKDLSRLLLLLFTISGLVTSCGSDDDDDGNEPAALANANKNDATLEPSLSRLEFPRVKPASSVVIIHSTQDRYGINFSTEWDYVKKSQRWSCYQMISGLPVGNYDSYFEEDPDLRSSYRLQNIASYYSGSGFDRGHICPSADRRYSKLANQQTYYYTNMQPQYHMFNAGPRLANGNQDWSKKSPWLKLEEQVRSWTNSIKGSSVDTLYVCKGGTIEDNQLLTTINGVLRVPKYFFVALLAKMHDSGGYRAVGFWIEHDNIDHSSNGISTYAVNVRQLEQLTGIDFFCNLPDNTENQVEALALENVKRAWGL